MSNYNGIAIIETELGGPRLVVKRVRARITTKWVKTATRTWDHSGKRLSAYRTGMMTIRLLSFCIDGQAPTIVAEATVAQ